MMTDVFPTMRKKKYAFVCFLWIIPDDSWPRKHNKRKGKKKRESDPLLIL
jgi:hypothetical protein